MHRSGKPARRRTPQQARSRETHDAIVEAAARLFAEAGLRRTTTARVAKLAGVSPGSMYQYFPSKEALVTAIYEREADRQHAGLLALVAELGTDDLPRLIRAFVSSTVETLERNIELHRVLLEELPRVSGVAAMRRIDALAAKTVATLLASARARVQPRDLEMAALLLVRASRYTTVALLDDAFEGVARRAFIDELSDMIAAYLLLPRTWS
ncbi:MAG TPA: TetR/AcrR family transcriptional regulator [Polyangiaceae bacterium]|nr:TetR/AcrR family transcriptional regulator [Polyangiaceae bacterium]